MRALFESAFWLGVVLFALGQIITFYPGAEAKWFFAASALLLPGLLINSKYYRIAGAILLFVSIAQGVAGYKRGLEYKKWLSNQPWHEATLKSQ